MIYGNVVKQYARSKYGYISEAEIVTESEAILEALQHEYDNYNNIVMNESYFADDHERALNEARLEVIQEALSGAIIAAIIAGIAALIGIIVAVVLILKKGKDKLKEKTGDKPEDLSEAEKKKIVDDVDEIVGIQDDDSGNDEKFKLTTYSSMDFSKFVKQGGLDSIVTSVEGIANGSSITDDNVNSLKAAVENQQKIHELLFEGIPYTEGKTYKQILIEEYIKNSKSFYDIMDDIDKVNNDTNHLFSNAQGMISTVRAKLKKLEDAYKKIQGNVGERGDDGNIKKNQDGSNKYTDNQTAVFKATSQAIKSMRSFFTAWENIETQRMRLVGAIWGRIYGVKSSSEKKDDKEEESK